MFTFKRSDLVDDKTRNKDYIVNTTPLPLIHVCIYIFLKIHKTAPKTGEIWFADFLGKPGSDTEKYADPNFELE